MDGSPGWQVMGHQSPRTPAAQHVENAVDNFASRVFDMDRLFRYGRDQRLQDLPLRVCQIRGIGFPVVHLFFSIPVLFTYASPFLYRLDDARLTLSKNISKRPSSSTAGLLCQSVLQKNLTLVYQYLASIDQAGLPPFESRLCSPLASHAFPILSLLPHISSKARG